MSLHHFKIRSSSVGNETTIEMDGQSLRGVVGIDIPIRLEQRNEITVTFIAAGLDVEIDAEVRALRQSSASAEITDMPSDSRVYVRPEVAAR